MRDMPDFTAFWKPWQKALAEKHSLTCPPGWYGFACGEGWKDIIDEAFSKLRALGWEGEIHQIKEKFGTLRMYVAGDHREAFWDVIREAEAKSGKTCEDCGGEGETGGRGWISTLCPSCRRKNEVKEVAREKASGESSGEEGAHE